MTKSIFGLKAPDAALILCVIALWAVVTFWNFGLPGFYMDEANHLAFIPGILSEAASNLHHYRLPDNMLESGHRFPIVGGAFYNTEIGTYVGLPFAVLFGFSLATARIYFALIELAAVLAGAMLLFRIFGRWPAFIFAVLLLTDPTNVMSVRSQAWMFWFLVLFAALAGHFLLSAYRNRQCSAWVPFLAGASISLAVLTYFVGVFVAVPLVLAGFLLFWREPKKLAAFILGGIVGYSPVIYAAASVYLASPSLLFGIMPEPSNAFSIFSLQNLSRYPIVWLGSFADYHLAQAVVGAFSVPFGWLRRLILLLTYIAIGVYAFKSYGERRGFYWISGLALVVCLVGFFFLKSLNAHHLLTFHVIALLALASLIIAKGPVRYFAYAASIAVLLTNVIALTNAQRTVVATGGLDLHNEAYTLPAELQKTEFAGYFPVFTFWGEHLQFLYLTNGTIPYYFNDTPNYEWIAKALAAQPKIALYVDSDVAFDPAKVLATVTEKRQFTDRKGTPLFDVYLMERQ